MSKQITKEEVEAQGLKPVFEVEVEQDRSGYSIVQCPFCSLEMRRPTAFGLMDYLCEHMNSAHPDEGKRGSA